jgi:hypothetical protein
MPSTEAPTIRTTLSDALLSSFSFKIDTNQESFGIDRLLYPRESHADLTANARRSSARDRFFSATTQPHDFDLRARKFAAVTRALPPQSHSQNQITLRRLSTPTGSMGRSRPLR